MSRFLALSPALPLLAAGALSTATVYADDVRILVELEPWKVHTDSGGTLRDVLFTVTGAVGYRTGSLLVYGGGGAGFVGATGRMGAALLPLDLFERGLLARLEFRPSVLRFNCGQTALLGHVGLGYRWALESRLPAEGPGPGLSIVPAFELGPAWVVQGCGTKYERPREETVVYGGTAALGIDF